MSIRREADAYEKPNGLLKKFIERVDQEEAKGKITTWRKHQDGEHFTHTSAEWGNKAWMKPHAEKGRLVFNIIKPKSETVSWLSMPIITAI